MNTPDKTICECIGWVRSSGNLLTTHHPKCKHYNLENDTRTILTNLLDGINAWAQDEDGVHPAAWDAYRDACLFVGRMDVEVLEPAEKIE